MRSLIREVIGYVAASAAALAIDVATLTLLVSALRVNYLAAAAAGFVGGTIFIYWISIRQIFRYRRLKDARIEFGVFLAVGVAGLAVNLAVMYLAVATVGLHYLIAKFCAAGCTFTVNFGLRRWLLFTHRRAPELTSVLDSALVNTRHPRP
jgi:putative flippase GtrA